MKSILSKDFKYTPAAQTDLRKLFQRIRREQKQASPTKVVPFRARAK